MRIVLVIAMLLAAVPLMGAAIRVDVNVMPRVVFTGDSQTCGRVGALDYPQMISWEMPVRVFNTAVGGTNTKHLVSETTGGTAEVSAGERVVTGRNVSWYAGPYPGQTIRLGAFQYVIDRIETLDYNKQIVNLWLTEPAREDFAGANYAIEAGWRVRIAERKPDYACFMYSVNDSGGNSEDFCARLHDMLNRTRAVGAQPIFLSGFPYIDKFRGGSHPGDNAKVLVRANDLRAFCHQHRIPFGDIFHTLMTLDEHCASVWVDTVHPTTDGSLPAIKALRHIFHEIGLAQNPYYVRGYRAPEGLAAPNESLAPFTTGQPDYTAQNVFNDNLFDLAAIKARDEYGLIAAADGDTVRSDTPIILKFGVGALDKIDSAHAQVLVASQTVVHVFDWTPMAWRTLAEGHGNIQAPLSSSLLENVCRDSAVWLALTSRDTLALDYAALSIQGDLAPYKPRPVADPVVWPQPDETQWTATDNFIANASLAQAAGHDPDNWVRVGDSARYLPCGAVATGSGAFAGKQRLNLFKSPGQRFTQRVRPLDVLTTRGATHDATERFLIAKVLDDETIELRRFPKSQPADLMFDIVRSAGCAAVPGGGIIQCRGDSAWQTNVAGIQPGQYSLSFFFRAYDPPNMTAKHRPGRLAHVLITRDSTKETLSTSGYLDTTFHWQRAAVEFTMPRADTVTIRVSARTDTPVEYTGFSLVHIQRRKP